MKKRVLIYILTLALLVSLCSCGDEKRDDSDKTNVPPPPVSSESKEPEVKPSGGSQEPSVPAEPEPEAFPYRRTVRVSTVKELADAIASNTRIILEAGVYNFSELDLAALDNPYILVDYDEFSLCGVNHLCLEAAEGADVELVTELTYTPVLEFDYCTGIVLKGLTCGHAVERGECSGSVLYLERCRDVRVEECSLYGCGTCGLETSESMFITMVNTEVYDCSDAILSFYETSQVEVSLCIFHDNYNPYYADEFHLVEVYGYGYNINIRNTEFVNNGDQVYYWEPIFLGYQGSCWMTIEDCVFQDSGELEEVEGVTYVNCTVSPMTMYGFVQTVDARPGENALQLDIHVVGPEEAASDTYIPFTAYRDTTSFYLLPEMGDLHEEVSADEFAERIKAHEMFVAFVVDADGTLLSVKQAIDWPGAVG